MVGIAGRGGRKRPTLSEVLAQRAQEAEEAKAREEERTRRIHALEALDQATLCTCPACTRMRALPGVVLRPKALDEDGAEG